MLKGNKKKFQIILLEYTSHGRQDITNNYSEYKDLINGLKYIY